MTEKSPSAKRARVVAAAWLLVLGFSYLIAAALLRRDGLLNNEAGPERALVSHHSA